MDINTEIRNYLDGLIKNNSSRSSYEHKIYFWTIPEGIINSKNAEAYETEAHDLECCIKAVGSRHIIYRNEHHKKLKDITPAEHEEFLAPAA